ncbi:cation:proton antiporter [Kitasatospora herbaricolor]|uniref:cation:proton antiporter domain-containing protein n=1 Tax=Kitasatospora herbaricolor TaxID=68217 RepID=UPI002E2F531C|nr:cation:proton antiporter [Kitasatospora herbaricolor]
MLLPPLYACAEELSLRDLRTVWRPVTVLSFGLVFASVAAVGFAAVAVAGLPPAMAFVLGAVLSSTDPVAVTALGRRLALPERVQVLVQAESQLKEATLRAVQGGRRHRGGGGRHGECAGAGPSTRCWRP